MPTVNGGFVQKFSLFAFRLMMRLITRLFFLPFYAILFAPWLMILIITGNADVTGLAFQIVAMLAGKPNAESLDAGDIGTAVLLVFVLIDVALELGATLRGEIGEKREGLTNKNRMKVQCGLSLVGWFTFAVLVFPQAGWGGSVIAVFLGVAVCFFFALEYSFREVWERVIKGITARS